MATLITLLRSLISYSKPTVSPQQKYQILQARIKFLKSYVNTHYNESTKNELLQRINVLKSSQLWKIAKVAHDGGTQQLNDVEHMIYSAHVENVMRQSQPLRTKLLEAC